MKSQPLQMPNPGKSQGPASPISNGHQSQKSILSHGFRSPWHALPLPPSHPLITGCILPWRCCSDVSPETFAPAPGRVPGTSLHTSRALHTHTPSTAVLIPSGFYHLFTICLFLTCELPQLSSVK